MKKATTIIAAFMLLFPCFSCDEKKEDEIESITEETTDAPDIIEPVDTAGEAPFITLDNSGFKDITILVKLKDETPPVDVYNIDTIDLDFGQKIPPCISAENREDYYYPSILEDEKLNLNEPQYGGIQEYAIGDGNAYFFVSYDSYCMYNNHSTAFFKYDIESGELSEIVSFEGLDETLSITPMNLKYLNGKLYYIGAVSAVDNTVHYGVYSIDTETGECEKVFDDDAFSDSDAQNYPLDALECQNGRLFAIDYSLGDYSDIKEQVIYEMDNDTGEWKEVFHETDLYAPALICGGKIVRTYRDDKKKVCIETDSYNFTSPYRSAKLVYADDKEAAFLQSDRLSKNWDGIGGVYGHSVLQVFNFEKKEHYSLDLAEIGAGTEIMKVKDGYFVTNADGVATPVYYLIPDLGLAFNEILGFAKNDISKDFSFNYKQTYSILNVNDDTVGVFGMTGIVYAEK